MSSLTTEQQIYQLQNIIDQHPYSGSKDLEYLQLVARQEKLLKSLPETERKEIWQDLSARRYKIILYTKNELKNLKDQYIKTIKIDLPQSPQQVKKEPTTILSTPDVKPQVEAKYKTLDELKADLSISELDKIKLLTKNGWDVEEILEKYN